MNIRNQARFRPVIISIVILVALVFLIWGNIIFVRNNPGGNDFLVNWYATRSFVSEGISPYSDSINTDIREMIYDEVPDVAPVGLNFDTPLYSILLFLPFSLIKDFQIARAVWMVFLEIAILFSVILTVSITKWRPGKLFILLILVFSFFWYHGIRPLVNGNEVIILLFCVVFTIYSLFIKQDELAGIIMGLMTINFEIVYAFIFFILFWSVANRRLKIIFWFFGSVLLLILVGLFLMPDWLIQYLRVLVLSQDNILQRTPASALAQFLPGIGYQLGIGLSIFAGLLILMEWVLGRKAEQIEFIWVASITLIFGQWFNIRSDPGNYIVMFPALIVVFSLVEERWKRYGFFINLMFLLLLFAVPWVVFLSTIDAGPQPFQSPVMMFPLPILLAVMIYWVRWWAKNPIKHTL